MHTASKDRHQEKTFAIVDIVICMHVFCNKYLRQASQLSLSAEAKKSDALWSWHTTATYSEQKTFTLTTVGKTSLDGKIPSARVFVMSSEQGIKPPEENIICNVQQAGKMHLWGRTWFAMSRNRKLCLWWRTSSATSNEQEDANDFTPSCLQGKLYVERLHT